MRPLRRSPRVPLAVVHGDDQLVLDVVVAPNDGHDRALALLEHFIGAHDVGVELLVVRGDEAGHAPVVQLIAEAVLLGEESPAGGP